MSETSLKGIDCPSFSTSISSVDSFPERTQGEIVDRFKSIRNRQEYAVHEDEDKDKEGALGADLFNSVVPM